LSRVVYTIGHSNRSFDEFIKLLKAHDVTLVVDVRRFPSSKVVPHFNRDYLEKELKKRGIKYVWLGDTLGGFRKPNYISYMSTKEWERGYVRLKALIKNYNLAIMCKEKLWFKCHRRFIADKLTAENYTVLHIVDERRKSKHTIQDKLFKPL